MFFRLTFETVLIIIHLLGVSSVSVSNIAWSPWGSSDLTLSFDMTGLSSPKYISCAILKWEQWWGDKCFGQSVQNGRNSITLQYMHVENMDVYATIVTVWITNTNASIGDQSSNRLAGQITISSNQFPGITTILYDTWYRYSIQSSFSPPLILLGRTTKKPANPENYYTDIPSWTNNVIPMKRTLFESDTIPSASWIRTRNIHWPKGSFVCTFSTMPRKSLPESARINFQFRQATKREKLQVEIFHAKIQAFADDLVGIKYEPTSRERTTHDFTEHWTIVVHWNTTYCVLRLYPRKQISSPNDFASLTGKILEVSANEQMPFLRDFRLALRDTNGRSGMQQTWLNVTQFQIFPNNEVFTTTTTTSTAAATTSTSTTSSPTSSSPTTGSPTTGFPSTSAPSTSAPSANPTTTTSTTTVLTSLSTSTTTSTTSKTTSTITVTTSTSSETPIASKTSTPMTTSSTVSSSTTAGVGRSTIIIQSNVKQASQTTGTETSLFGVYNATLVLVLGLTICCLCICVVVLLYLITQNKRKLQNLNSRGRRQTSMLPDDHNMIVMIRSQSSLDVGLGVVPEEQPKPALFDFDSGDRLEGARMSESQASARDEEGQTTSPSGMGGSSLVTTGSGIQTSSHGSSGTSRRVSDVSDSEDSL